MTDTHTDTRTQPFIVKDMYVTMLCTCHTNYLLLGEAGAEQVSDRGQGIREPGGGGQSDSSV